MVVGGCAIVVRGPVLRVALIAGPSRGWVSALSELLRLPGWLAFQGAVSKRCLEALALLPGRAQAHRLRWRRAEGGTSLWLVPARSGSLEVRVPGEFSFVHGRGSQLGVAREHGVANWRSWFATRFRSTSRPTRPSSGQPTAGHA